MERSTSTTKPAQVYRLRGISVSIFRNEAKQEGRSVPYYKVSLQRTYKSGDEFKTTTVLSRDDLPVAELLLKKAWQFILEAEAEQGSDASEGGS
jgi:hypothetical protein